MGPNCLRIGEINMLMLDHMTLFYFSLRDLNVDWYAQLVNDWVRKVSPNANMRSTHQKLTPTLTHDSTCSSHCPQLTPSALPAAHISPHDNSVKIIKCDLSDLVGTKGNEQEAAIK